MYKGGCLLYASLDLLLREAHVARRIPNICLHGLIKQLILRILHNKPYAITDLLYLLGLGPNILTVQQDPAALRPQKAVEKLHHGRFTGAGVADHAGDLSLFKPYADMVQCNHLKRRTAAVYVRNVF